MTGQRAQIAVRVDEFGVTKDIIGYKRFAHEFGMCAQERGNLFPTFFRLK